MVTTYASCEIATDGSHPSCEIPTNDFHPPFEMPTDGSHSHILWNTDSWFPPTHPVKHQQMVFTYPVRRMDLEFVIISILWREVLFNTDLIDLLKDILYNANVIMQVYIHYEGCE